MTPACVADADRGDEQSFFDAWVQWRDSGLGPGVWCAHGGKMQPNKAGRAWWLLTLGVVACTRGTSDTGLGVEEDTEPAVLDDTAPFPVDTSEVSLDEEPAHTVLLIEQGNWSLSPLGGPYTSLVGSLLIVEYIDGPPDPDDTAPPPCQVEIALTGSPAAATCPGCAFSFEVLHQVVSGDLSQCHDPDRPANASLRRLGFDSSTGTIRWQQGSLWFDWYQAQQVGDQVNFSFTTTLGVKVEE
jgi:hypothetical protein